MNYPILDEARRKARAARDALAAATHAVQRAQKQVAVELLKVREGERRLDAARDRPTYDAECTALESARKDHALAIKRLTDRQSEQAHADRLARAAEAAMVGAVDQILADEIAERATLVEDHLNQALCLGTALKYFAVAAGVHSTKVISPSTLSVLDRLSQPLIDGHSIPNHMGQLGDIVAFREWTARRAAMIDGDEETAPKAA
jgi:hypothetical protein